MNIVSLQTFLAIVETGSPCAGIPENECDPIHRYRSAQDVRR